MSIVQTSKPPHATKPAKGEPVARRAFGLTPREVEIVSTVAQAFSNRDIAEHFAISETTVKHHLTNIFDKTGVSTRLELAMFALHHGIADVATAANP